MICEGLLDGLTQRVLQKVRVKELRRKASRNREQEEDENKKSYYNNPLDPLSDIIPITETTVLDQGLCMLETKKKIYIEYQFLCMFQNIDTIQDVNEPGLPKKIHMDIKLNPNFPIYPVEYVNKRLESYGDLELATWGRRVKNYYQGYYDMMNEYFSLFVTGDPVVFERLRKAQLKAKAACREIEKQDYYHMYEIFASLDRLQFTQCNFSETGIKKLGFTMEEFVEFTKKNGFHEMQDKKTPMNFDFMNIFMTLALPKCDQIIEGKTYDITVARKDRTRMAMKLKSVIVLEPSIEGIHAYVYYLMVGDDKKVETGLFKDRLKAYKNEGNNPDEEMNKSAETYLG